jgi:hypothetical protein
MKLFVFEKKEALINTPRQSLNNGTRPEETSASLTHPPANSLAYRETAVCQQVR